MMNAAPLWFWMTERHHIALARDQQLPPPWTTDPILQSYRFCNVFRERDVVTKWLANNWRGPALNYAEWWFPMVVARLINWPDTLQDIQSATDFPGQGYWNPEATLKVMRARATRGLQVYTGAYMLRGPDHGGDKAAYTVKILTDIWNAREEGNRIAAGRNLQNMWTWLKSHYGMGSFLAYEVVTDLRWMDPWREPTPPDDILSWANAGPGAVRGLNRLHGFPVTRTITKGGSLEMMKELLRDANMGQVRMDRVGTPRPSNEGPLPPGFPFLELRDIEHSLCEVDKYLRVQFQEGKPRAKYHYTDTRKLLLLHLPRATNVASPYAGFTLAV